MLIILNQRDLIIKQFKKYSRISSTDRKKKEERKKKERKIREENGEEK